MSSRVSASSDDAPRAIGDCGTTWEPFYQKSEGRDRRRLWRVSQLYRSVCSHAW